MWPTSNFLKGIWATLGPYHILASLAPPLVPSTSSPLRTAVKYPPFLKVDAIFSFLEAKSIQEWPGAPRGKPGKEYPGLPGELLAFPWVPLALPVCPWLTKNKHDMYFEGKEGNEEAGKANPWHS